jgi:glycosyltransferase involved in cell wall biosynthesis
MVQALIRNNPGHEIILIREKKDSELKGASQIAIPNTRLLIGFASLRLFFLVPFILNRKKVDVVIEPAHFGPFNLYGRTKRITIIHDLTPILFPDLHRWHSQILQKLFLKKILNKAHLIISNSENTKKDIQKVYPQNRNKVKKIYPGISTVFQKTMDKVVLDKHSIKTPYFLNVGTIEPRKNLNVLLEAFTIFMQKTLKPISLVIAGGNGWKSDSFFDTLKHHPFKDQIHYLGFVDTSDLPALYSQAEAFIYPSRYEGFGLPVVESMACGTPVITADNSSLNESGGETTRYFNANDVDKLAEYMLEFADNPNLKNEMSAPMKEHLKKFNWDHFAVELWDSIQAL